MDTLEKKVKDLKIKIKELERKMVKVTLEKKVTNGKAEYQ